LLAYVTGHLLRAISGAFELICGGVGHFPKPLRTLLAGVLWRLRRIARALLCHDFLL